MILLDKKNEVIKVAVSTEDMASIPTTMTIINRQNKQQHTLNLTNVQTNERTAIYKFFVYTTEPSTTESNVTYIDNSIIADGSYDYTIGDEIGLFQIGIPSLVKTEYTTQENNITYYGE